MQNTPVTKTRLCELVGKPLISLSDAVILGRVSAVYFDYGLRRAKMLEITPNGEGEVSLKYLAIRYIRELRFDAVMIKNADQITLAWNTILPPVRCPLGHPVYDHDGLSLGTLDDVELINFNIAGITTSQKKYPPSKILSAGNDVLIINDSDRKIKIQRTRTPRIPKIVEDISVAIHAPQTASPMPQPLPQPLGEGDSMLPTRINQSQTLVTKTPASTPPSRYDFLLGKTLTQDILDQNGKILFYKSALITPGVIQTAKRIGKLVHLALHSRS